MIPNKTQTNGSDGTTRLQQQQVNHENIPNDSTFVGPWQVHPASSFSSLQQQITSKVKLVHFVRHAEGTHNVNDNWNDIVHLDARLTDHGKEQCAALATKTRTSTTNNQNTLCVWTSPLTRCLQTTLRSFPHLFDKEGDTICLALDAWRETVNYHCDRRRPKAALQQDFGHVVDFSLVHGGEDPLWHDYRTHRIHQPFSPAYHMRDIEDYEGPMESAELHRVAQRGRIALQQLMARPESEMIVCTHSAFLRCILHWAQSDDGKIPLQMDQWPRDETEEDSRPLFDYSTCTEEEATYLKSDYDNCEMRSFCLVQPAAAILPT